MKIFNDMDMQLEEFQPIEPGKVKMYACGPTVYNYIHVGNARPIVIFDVLRRYLEYRVVQLRPADHHRQRGQCGLRGDCGLLRRLFVPGQRRL